MILKSSSFLLLSLCCLSLLSCNERPAEKETTTPEKVNTLPQTKPEEEVALIQIQPEADTLKGSLKAKASGKIGSASILIHYYSPAVRERIVWGGLVPYKKVWVTGAHRATSLETDQAIHIGGKELPAGKYALFTFPGEKEWTVIINKNWDQHLADDYAEKEDVICIPVQAEKVAQNQERLRYEIQSQSDNTGAIVLTWEKIKLAIPVSI
jgi:hypothetical protein